MSIDFAYRYTHAFAPVLVTIDCVLDITRYYPIWSYLIVLKTCRTWTDNKSSLQKFTWHIGQVPSITRMVYLTIGELSCQEVETMSGIIPLRSPVKKWSAGLLRCHAKHIECGSVWEIWMIWEFGLSYEF